MKKLLGLTLITAATLTGCMKTTATVANKPGETKPQQTEELTQEQVQESLAMTYSKGTTGLNSVATIHGEEDLSVTNQLFAEEDGIESCTIDFEITTPEIPFIGSLSFSGTAKSDATKVLATNTEENFGIFVDTTTSDVAMNLEAMKAFSSIGTVTLPTWYNDGWSLVDETLPENFITEIEDKLISCGDIPMFYDGLISDAANAPADQIEKLIKDEDGENIWFEADWVEVVNGEEKSHYFYIKFNKEDNMPVEFRMDVEGEVNINTVMRDMNTTVVEMPVLA